MKKVLLTSTMYPLRGSGWQGIFIRNIVNALSRRPDVNLSLWAPPGEVPGNVAIAATDKESAWLASLVKKGGISYLMRNGGLKGKFAPLTLLRMLSDAYRRDQSLDLYHINWLQSAIPLPKNDIPALITVLGNDLNLLRLPFVRSMLRRVMKDRRVMICPNADWMVKELEEHFGDLAGIESVSFGIDPVWYDIRRDVTGPSLQKWLAVTRLTHNKLGPLFDWSAPIFSDGRRELHLFGPMEEKIKIPPWVNYHGPATPATLAHDWFPHCAGLVTLSKHSEGRPQVMLEAMAAGLPIVASDMPAHSSLVQDSNTGYICSNQDRYAHAIQALEDDGKNQLFGMRARAHALNTMGTWDDCAARYDHIYRKLLARS